MVGVFYALAIKPPLSVVGGHNKISGFPGKTLAKSDCSHYETAKGPGGGFLGGFVLNCGYEKALQ